MRRDYGTSIPPPPPIFSCIWDEGGLGAAWVRPVGELDLATVSRLSRALEAAIRRARLVVVDLRQLRFMDSQGVHALVDATRSARSRDGRLVLLSGPPRIERLFALTATGPEVERISLPYAEPAVQALLHLPERPRARPADDDGPEAS